MDKVLAFDFGASSGRAILGALDNGKITLEEIHRFDNDPVMVNDGFYWDVLRLFHEIKQGILKAKHTSDFLSIGIDTWGVDFGMIDKNGKLLGNPYNYRDIRTEGIPEKVRDIISDKDLYMQTGNQIMNLNTLFQLYSMLDTDKEILNLTDTILLMPDLFNYFLTGEKYSECSIASTTQMLQPITKQWNLELLDKLGINNKILPKIIPSGTVVGKLKEDICTELDITPKDVIAVASHDTASAVAAVPTKEKDFVFISCGTWSLFGTELDEPVITPLSQSYNITNEVGYNNTTRFLKNIIGLWLIQETRRQYHREGKQYSYAEMEQLAKNAKPFSCFIDPDSPEFVSSGNIPKRIKEFCKRTNQYIPNTDGEVIRCIYESLAMKYKFTFEQLKECCNKDFKVIHMVGGGTKDSFLCQMTSNATNVPVIAGPIEGTAIGNIAVQFITQGKIKNILEARNIISNSFPVVEYLPQNSDWNEAYKNFLNIM